MNARHSLRAVLLLALAAFALACSGGDGQGGADAADGGNPADSAAAAAIEGTNPEEAQGPPPPPANPDSVRGAVQAEREQAGLPAAPRPAGPGKPAVRTRAECVAEANAAGSDAEREVLRRTCDNLPPE